MSGETGGHSNPPDHTVVLSVDEKSQIQALDRTQPGLRAPINRFVEETNRDPRPFIWTADPNRILAAVIRGKQTFESITSLLSRAVAISGHSAKD